VVLAGVAGLALAAGLVLGPTAFRALQALRHHGLERALQEVRRFEPPWRGPLVAYERATPAEAGLDGARLDAWTRALAARGTRQLLVVRSGRLVHEWLAPSRRVNDLVHVSAIAKGSAAAPALGALVDAGRVAFDDPAWRFIPAWRDDPLRSRIRLRMLANHTSGIQNIVYGGDGAGLSGWEKEFSDDHALRFPLTLSRAEVEFTPGSRVRYTSLAYYALSYALTAALRGSDVPDLHALLARRIHAPLEIPPDAWSISYGRHDELDGMRLYTLASGAAYTPRALARIAELFLGGGSWNGRRILRPDTVAELLSDAGVPERRSPHEPVPALGWWLNRDGFFPSLPPDAVVTAGANHRVVAFVPSLDLVVVRLGSSLHEPGTGGGFWDGIDAQVFAPLVEALVR
jgi:CubicO group peptidase (beta-lactamase class C family)